MSSTFPLGRHVNHDARSLAYPFTADDGTTLVSKRWERKVPVFDQGNLGSCTGNASTGCCGTEPYYDALPAGVVLDENTAISVYSDATKIDGAPGEYPPTDTGSDGVSVAKIVQQRGWISGYQHAFTLNDALAAVSNHGPVIVGTNWYSGMFNPSLDGELVIHSGDTVAGGHEYILDEIDVPNQRVWMQNSWGTSWGLNGRAWMTWSTLQRLLSEQGDVTVFVPVNKPAPTPQPIPVPPAPVPPTPTPAPTPAPVVSDAALWSAVSAWALRHHYNPTCKAVANELVQWATSNGLH